MLQLFDTILVRPLFNLLAVIYAILPGHDFGVAIIILTIIVRIILWPLVNKQLHSQRAMQQIQPEVARIRSESKGDKQKESAMLMELYREKGINPFSSLLPLLVQLPVFIALYAVLRDMIKPGEIAQLAYPTVKQLGVIADVLKHGGSIQPTFLGFINLAKPAVGLAAIAAICQFFQTKMLSPKQPQGDAQAQAVASMIYIFPVITFLIGLSLPAALALYWITTSLVAIFQQWLILRRDVVELETATPRVAAQASQPKKSVPKKGSAKKGGA
jgi:YidC/Oxa1 family membrane protein insertase